jgi:hypothetical protein
MAVDCRYLQGGLTCHKNFMQKKVAVPKHRHLVERAVYQNLM